MKIGKWHIDFDENQYWVYHKKALHKDTNKEFPKDTSYFNTLSGALNFVRHELIGTKIGQAKEDDLSRVIKYITDVDKYFVKQLNKLTNEQKKLVDKLAKGQTETTVEPS